MVICIDGVVLFEDLHESKMLSCFCACVQGVLLLTCCQLQHLEQWDIVTCGGRQELLLALEAFRFFFPVNFQFLFIMFFFSSWVSCKYLSFTTQGWSLSDVMFVTKHNMANAVATVSKQLEHVSEALAVSTGVICANV